jgi:hypothetical protein
MDNPTTAVRALAGRELGSAVTIRMRSRIAVIGLLAVLVLVLVLLWRGRAAGTDTQPSIGATWTLVLIELFTSEGCSSCPPADALLGKLDRSQPVSEADLIVLSEHVDYWNDIGWKDPYSFRDYSDRQVAYAKRFDINSVYTAQMVGDGYMKFVGGDEREATNVFENAAKAEKIPVAFPAVHLEGNNKLVAHVEAAPLVRSTGPNPRDCQSLWLTTAINSCYGMERTPGKLSSTGRSCEA